MLTLFFIILCWLQTTSCKKGDARPCALRDYGDNKKVCVCNSTYCDTIPRVTNIGEQEYVTIISSRDGLRFKQGSGRFGQNAITTGVESYSLFSWLIEKIKRLIGFSTSDSLKIQIFSSVRYQKINGFGGAFTDSAGINILSLERELQELLMRSYFSEEGLEYNLCRLPIGGTDFSTHQYSYDDNNNIPDHELRNFSLAMEDLTYKIPLIQWAQEMSERTINLVTASWSPPPWMKSNDDYSGLSVLRPEYYASYAKYHLRFLDEYKKHNVTIWAMSTGNEPNDGLNPIINFNTLGWAPMTMATWITEHFGPQMRNSPHNKTQLLAFDDHRLFLPWWIELLVIENAEVLDYIDGFAVHWYFDFLIPDSVIKALHDKFPSKFVLYTEATKGNRHAEKNVDLGSWERGEEYLSDIIQNLNVFVTGWIDWNLALDEQGGPNWSTNYIDSPILVNSTGREFYKQPMFYALGHVSKFIERDAERIELTAVDDPGLQSTAIRNPDGRIVIVMINKNDNDTHVSILVPEKGWINMELPSRSFTTILCQT